MTLPSLWVLWGLSWLVLPRATVGLLLIVLTSHDTLGALLIAIGFVIDISN